MLEVGIHFSCTASLAYYQSLLWLMGTTGRGEGRLGSQGRGGVYDILGAHRALVAILVDETAQTTEHL